MDTGYMQMEKMRGMAPEGRPRSLEAPEPEMDDAGYTGSDKRCESCEHFDGAGACAIGVNGGTCEPMGHCNKHEGGEQPDADERAITDGE
jgi:hypothetical protein